VGSRLSILARMRAKPAIPFGGIYRIIDFTMSNIANSGIDVAGVLTQYKPLSLMEHIDNGRPWDLFGKTRLVEILPPKTGEEISDWYKGTSDAVYQNLDFVEDFSPDMVLILSGDHIYHMDYNELKKYHQTKKADVTISLIRVPLEQAHQFGIAELDKTSRIIKWVEKPKRPRSNLASMGIYIFNTPVLKYGLIESARRGGVDFAKDVIPLLLKEKFRVSGYEFTGYWRDVGTIDAYWNCNMDLLRKDSGLKIEEWNIRTNIFVRGEIGAKPPAYIGRNARISNSLISSGCVIEGWIENSILSPGVIVKKGAKIVDSIVFHNAVIQENVSLLKVIVDKNVKIGKETVIGHGELIPNRKLGVNLSTGITVIGKNANIPDKFVIGKNCIISPGADLGTYKLRKIASGSVL
ncbi:MAG: sugar phosphate nucleotidyltransferase, partial [candidate division WOR-3 bacterium]|nr:sugar phosphate nucleotidyltransferase [candidate division WOR-3 bacterium]